MTFGSSIFWFKLKSYQYLTSLAYPIDLEADLLWNPHLTALISYSFSFLTQRRDPVFISAHSSSLSSPVLITPVRDMWSEILFPCIKMNQIDYGQKYVDTWPSHSCVVLPQNCCHKVGSMQLKKDVFCTVLVSFYLSLKGWHGVVVVSTVTSHCGWLWLGHVLLVPMCFLRVLWFPLTVQSCAD